MHGLEPAAKRLRVNGDAPNAVGLTEAPSQATAAERWRQTMHTVVRSVVSVHFSSVLPFDTEQVYVSEATGFVVDAERGIIMTNRHVVGPGPFRGFAVFDNHEECPVRAIYRDPVHDFGFLRFDPAHIKHMPVWALSLKPENAHVGAEIRVVGNDAGEKLSILAGFISRLDRNAPDYGELTYNDFNTEYIQAAAAASGGSSGSPVVDFEGNVLALQAGGSTVASTDYFLPLYRGARALKCIQEGRPVTRGTIQVQWLLKPFDECIRLGLGEEAEREARKNHPQSIGLLVAETVLPGGPAEHLVQEGDCLLAINGTPVARFRDVDAVLDASVGETVNLTLCRGGETKETTVNVQDLHSITPSRLVRFGGGVFHDISYQIARYYAFPVRGVYVAHTGIYIRPAISSRDRAGWIIDELNHEPTPDLDAFIRVVRSLPRGSRVVAQCRHVTDPHTVVPAEVTCADDVDADEKDLALASRDDSTGQWEFEALGPLPPRRPAQVQHAEFSALNFGFGSQACRELVRSFVKVRATAPVAVEGATSAEFVQHGFIVDAERGYVLVSRLAVPHYGVNVSVEVAESVVVDARVVFLHPLHNFGIVQFDRALVDAPLKTLDLASIPLKQGDGVVFVGYDSRSRPVVTRTSVSDVVPTEIPVGFDVPPRYRATNIDTITLDSSTVPESSAGVLADENTGQVRALWMSFLADINQTTFRDRQFRLALDATEFGPVVAALRSSGSVVDPRFVDVEARAISFAAARIRNVPEKWLTTHNTAGKHQLIEVSRVASSLRDHLHEGDVLVALNDQPLNSVSQLTDLDLTNQKETEVDLTLVRRGSELRQRVPTAAASDTVVPQLVGWCGMVVHRPHHAVLQQLKRPPSGVYIASTQLGSPANMYSIWQTSFVTHISGKPTPDVDSFYRIVSEVPDDTYVTIRVVTYEGVPQARSIRTNYHYFPTWRKHLNREEKRYV